MSNTIINNTSRNNMFNRMGKNMNNTSLINCYAINVNSLIHMKKRYDLQVFLNGNDIDIAMISETKLSEKHKLKLLNHNTFRTNRKSLIAAKGGGTALIINKIINATQLTQPHYLKLKCLEYTAAKIKTNSNHSLIVISLYANHIANTPLGEDLQSLFDALKLQENSSAFIMAGDLNARHRSWGDSNDNYKGCSLVSWLEKFNINNKVAHFQPGQPTFRRANSFLDHCIIDQRLTIVDASNNKVNTTPYDSDHRAIVFKVNISNITKGLASANPIPARPQFKKTNWDKFNKHLINVLKEHQLAPRDCNMTIKQIDDHILLLEKCIHQTIKAIVPTSNKGYKNGYLIYENNWIIRLHKLKSRLITRLNEISQFTSAKEYNHEYIFVKATIKLVNNKLQNEYLKSVTAYWDALHRSIDHRNQANFFPKINRFLRPKTPIQINNLKVKANDSILNKVIDSTQHNDPEHTFTFDDKFTKLEIIGNYFESINSPRYYNVNHETKAIVDIAAEDIRNNLLQARLDNTTLVNFSNELPAHDAIEGESTVNFNFHSYIEVTKISRNMRNKTSSGIDNIPAIVIKNLSTTVLTEYTIIFNNAMNQHYYPTRWKMAKVLPILKKEKDQSSPTSYGPISLTSNVSKLF